MTSLDGKGQIFSTDLMLASVVFLLILTTAAIYSNGIANRLFFLEQDEEMLQAGQQAANALVLTQGNPANWQSLPSLDGVNSFGLADSPNMLNASKVARLSSLASSDYEAAKSLLGMAKFDFRLDAISQLDGFALAGFGPQPESESRVVSISRMAYYDGNNVVVRLRVFE